MRGIYRQTDRWTDGQTKREYLSKEIIHERLILHRNLNVITSSITLLLNTQIQKVDIAV